MIDKIKKTVKMQNGGGIRALPLPPSSPNVPAVYNREPLFSLKGLQQRYAGLPGYVRKPASAAGRFIFPKNPYVRAAMYGVPAFQAAGGVEGIKQRLNPSMETIIERSRRNNLGTRTTTLEELGISPMMDAQQKLATDITEAANQSVPLIPGTDVLSGSVIEKIEENTGITLPPDGGNIVKQADAKDTGVSTEKYGDMMFNFEDSFRELKQEGRAFPDKEPERDTGLEEIRQQNILDQASPPGPGGGVDASQDDFVIDIDEETADEELQNRDNQNTKANQIYYDNIFKDIIQSGRSAEALLLDQQVKDIMGPDSKRSKNLLLLQLASNLISGRTDQPGFKGFLDVLGQAGNKTIPLALALEEQRREDERELKKALINAKGKTNISKMGKIEGIGVFVDKNGEKRKGPLKYSEEGIPYVTVFDPNGKNPRDINVYGRLEETMKFPDPKQKQDILNEIKMFSRALQGSREILDTATRMPSDIGAVGTVKRTFLRAKDIINQVTGKLNYDDVRADLGLVQSQLISNINANRSTYTEDEFEDVQKAVQGLFENTDNIMKEAGSDDNALARQAKIRSIQLFTSYALANILKNKDRLAVQDIKRAEQITDAFGILKSPTDIIYAYKELSDQLEEALADKIAFADSIGISDATIDKLRFETEGDAAKRERIDKTLDNILDSNLEGYGGLDDLIKLLQFDKLPIIGPKDVP